MYSSWQISSPPYWAWKNGRGRRACEDWEETLAAGLPQCLRSGVAKRQGMPKVYVPQSLKGPLQKPSNVGPMGPLYRYQDRISSRPLTQISPTPKSKAQWLWLS